MISDIDNTEKSVISIHKEYAVQGFEWSIEVLFRQGLYNAREINKIRDSVSKLLDIEHQENLKSLFSSNVYNSAMAISDKSNKRSVVIITQVTSMSQFVNSLTHEMLHISRHIDECGNNEELFTALGDIAGKIVKELYSI